MEIAAVSDAKQGSLRLHDSHCFAGKAIYRRFEIFLDFLCYSRSPDRARREQPIGALGLCVRARVRSVWRVEVQGILKRAEGGFWRLGLRGAQPRIRTNFRALAREFLFGFGHFSRKKRDFAQQNPGFRAARAAIERHLKRFRVLEAKPGGF